MIDYVDYILLSPLLTPSNHPEGRYAPRWE